MSGPVIVEWAPFRMVEGTMEATLVAAADALQQEFLEKQPGFLSRELLRGTDGQWTDVIHWASQAHADAAMARAMESPACMQYFSLMVGSDQPDFADSVMHLTRVKRYGRQ